MITLWRLGIQIRQSKLYRGFVEWWYRLNARYNPACEDEVRKNGLGLFLASRGIANEENDSPKVIEGAAVVKLQNIIEQAAKKGQATQ